MIHYKNKTYYYPDTANYFLNNEDLIVLFIDEKNRPTLKSCTQSWTYNDTMEVLLDITKNFTKYE